jgi:hypothetical protein
VKGNTGKMYRLSMIICTLFQNSKMGQIEGIEKVLFCRVMDRRIKRDCDYIGDPPPPPPELGGPSGSALSFKGSKGQPCKIISSLHLSSCVLYKKLTYNLCLHMKIYLCNIVGYDILQMGRKRYGHNPWHDSRKVLLDV